MSRLIFFLSTILLIISCHIDEVPPSAIFANYHQYLEYVSCSQSNFHELDDSLIIFVPNILTPDGDGYNDVLFVGTNGMFSEFDFHLYKPLGGTVFHTTDAFFSWPDTLIPDTSILLSFNLHGIVNGQMVNLSGSVSCLVEPTPVHESFDLINCQLCEYGSMYDPRLTYLLPNALDSLMCP